MTRCGRTFAAPLILFLLTFPGCGKSESTPPAASIDSTAPAASVETGVNTTPVGKTPAARQPEVTLKTSAGDIRIRLNMEKAPVTVDNFLENYARRGFYAGTIVHYVADNMIVAGGFDRQFNAKETRAPIINEAANGLKNRRGTIAMIREPEYAQSATSQFFINVVDNSALDYQGNESNEDYGYCVFGEVVAGMDVVDAIAKSAVHDQGDFVSTPVRPIVIESVEQVR